MDMDGGTKHAQPEGYLRNPGDPSSKQRSGRALPHYEFYRCSWELLALRRKWRRFGRSKWRLSERLVGILSGRLDVGEWVGHTKSNWNVRDQGNSLFQQRSRRADECCELVRRGGELLAL